MVSPLDAANYVSLLQDAARLTRLGNTDIHLQQASCVYWHSSWKKTNRINHATNMPTKAHFRNSVIDKLLTTRQGRNQFFILKGDFMNVMALIQTMVAYNIFENGHR